MKAENLREMNTDELNSELEGLQRKLFDLRSQAVTETLENPKFLRNVRKDIARIKTVLKQRQSP